MAISVLLIVFEVIVRFAIKYSPFIMAFALTVVPPVLVAFRSYSILKSHDFVFSPDVGIVPSDVVAQRPLLDFTSDNLGRSFSTVTIAEETHEATVLKAVVASYEMLPPSSRNIRRIYTIYEIGSENTQSRRVIEDTFCFFSVGRKYDIDPYLLKAISIVESGMRSGTKNENSNGTVDYGHMQINTLWVEKLDLDTNRLVNDPCYCTDAAAQILRRLFDQYGRHWETVGKYHSFRIQRRNRYFLKVKKIYEKIKTKGG